MGAARIIDISDERKPRVISNLRLQVNQPADHAAASGDPGALSPVQGYAAHYCSLSSEVDPTVVACSFITSGLRVFDITDLLHPKEIAYYVAPTQPRAENGFMASDFAMSKPAIVPGPARGLVHGRRRAASTSCGSEAWPSAARRAGARLPRAARADRAAQDRPRAAREGAARSRTAAHDFSSDRVRGRRGAVAAVSRSRRAAPLARPLAPTAPRGSSAPGSSWSRRRGASCGRWARLPVWSAPLGVGAPAWGHGKPEPPKRVLILVLDQFRPGLRRHVRHAQRQAS